MIRHRLATLEEIRRKGLEALTRELGPLGMARFLQQFESGQGDYTADRRQWLAEEDVQSLAIKIQAARSDAEKPSR